MLSDCECLAHETMDDDDTPLGDVFRRFYVVDGYSPYVGGAS